MLLVEGVGRVTSAGDIPDHQHVEMIKDKWKAYRNIIKEGFFFNDSVIVLADYSDNENDIKDHVITNGDNDEYKTTANNVKKTEAFIDIMMERIQGKMLR